MEKITMLGTGNAAVTNCYNTCFTLKNGNEYILVDGGGGNQILKQLQLANIELTDIHHAILTHPHTDHLFGMIWIYRMIGTKINQGKYEGDFHIYCHDQAKETIESIVKATLTKKLIGLLDQRIFITEVQDMQEIEILGTKTIFFDVGSTKMKQYGFQMELDKGRLVCLGDEPCAKHIEPFLDNAYLVMHEAFCLYEERDIFKPYEKHHSTAKDAAILAQAHGVKNLVLYHTEENHLPNRKELYTNEAQEFYNGNVFVPEDLESIDL